MTNFQKWEPKIIIKKPFLYLNTQAVIKAYKHFTDSYSYESGFNIGDSIPTLTL